jgi:hypothetical protein
MACDVGDAMGEGHEPEAHLMKVDRSGEVILTPETALVIHKFLVYAFEPIDYQWKNLTTQEKALCTEEDFNKVIAWMKGN